MKLSIQVYVALPHLSLGILSPDLHRAWVDDLTENLYKESGVIVGVHEAPAEPVYPAMIYVAYGLQKGSVPHDACERVQAAMNLLWQRFRLVYTDKIHLHGTPAAQYPSATNYPSAVIMSDGNRETLNRQRAEKAGHAIPDLVALLRACFPRWDLKRARDLAERFVTAVHTDVRQFHQTALQSLSRRVRAGNQEHPFQGSASNFELASLIEWATSGNCPSRNQHGGPISTRQPKEDEHA